MQNFNAVNNPIVPGQKIGKDEGGVQVDHTLFKQMVGSLMYLTATRPDLMFVVSFISRFMGAPTQLHFQTLKRVLRLHLLLSVAPVAVFSRRCPPPPPSCWCILLLLPVAVLCFTGAVRPPPSIFRRRLQSPSSSSSFLLRFSVSLVRCVLLPPSSVAVFSRRVLLLLPAGASSSSFLQFSPCFPAIQLQ
ncbi:hypothetical protein V2J09_007696 [Rumex salicifolius]